MKVKGPNGERAADRHSIRCWLAQWGMRSIAAMSPDPATLTILHYPALVLRQRAQAIASVDQPVRDLAARMIELMHEAEGIGLAAPQVGVPWRMFVTSGNDQGEPDRVYINPRIVEISRDLSVREEGCLSLPGITAEIRRPSRVTIVATDLDGNEFTLNRNELLARAWQHELDHLDGVLIVDRMSPLDRLAMRKRIRELEAAAG